MSMRLCPCRNARAVSRNVKGTISDSQDLCILANCGECGVNDASGEQATRSLNIFMEWRGQTSSVMSQAHPVKTVNAPPVNGGPLGFAAKRRRNTRQTHDHDSLMVKLTGGMVNSPVIFPPAVSKIPVSAIRPYPAKRAEGEGQSGSRARGKDHGSRRR